MKRIIAFFAGLAATIAVSAQTFAPLTVSGFEFTPVFVQANPIGGGLFDNYTLEVGGRNATFGSQSMVVYSLEREYGNPPAGWAYSALPNDSQDMGKLFSVAGPIDTALKSGALQLAVWQLNGTKNFNVVNDPYGAWGKAQTWISQLGDAQSITSLSVLENKNYNYFITATNPVPEPTTYALMLAGLAAVAMLQARRKKA